MLRGKFWMLASLGVVGSLVAMDAVAVEPCSRLPQGGNISVTIPSHTMDTACDANCTGIPLNVPLPPNPAWSYTDGSHSECAISTGGPANGKCKKATVCAPGYTRTAVNNVWKCVRPAYSETKACPFRAPKRLPFKIESAKTYVKSNGGAGVDEYFNINDNVERARSKPKGVCVSDGSTGINSVVLRGPAVAGAISARIPDLPGVNVSLLRPEPNDTRPAQCLLPNCVIALFKLPEGAQLNTRKLEIKALDGRTSDTQLKIVEGREWVQSQCKRGGGSGGQVGSISGGTSSTGTTPTEQSYVAGMSCPGTETVNGVTHPFTTLPATFIVNHPSGSVTATAMATMTEQCGWEDAIKFRIEGPSAQDILFTPRYSSGSIVIDPVSIQLSNGTYNLTPNSDWPYGYNINITFSQ